MTDFLTVFVSCQKTNNSCLFSILLQRILTLYSRTYPIKTIFFAGRFCCEYEGHTRGRNRTSVSLANLIIEDNLS